MKNHYEVRGDITVIFLKSKKHGDMETVVSTNKLDRIKEFPNSWYPHYSKSNDSFYVYGHVSKVRGKAEQTFLHRWITNAPKDMVVDHANHNTLDNTDGNLFVCTRTENQINRARAAKHNSTGVLGVTWSRSHKKWRARIDSNKKPLFTGLYDDFETAVKEISDARELILAKAAGNPS